MLPFAIYLPLRRNLKKYIEMKKILLLLLGCTMSIFCFADEGEGSISDDPDIFQKPHKVPNRAPRVSYEGGNLYIVSPYGISDAGIIIHDMEGNIIYNMITDLPASSYVIPLPLDIITSISSIELCYRDNYIFLQL